MDKPRSPEVEAFWNAYRVARNVPEEDYVVCSFGSSPEMSDELLALVLYGADRPRAIWRTRTVDVKPLGEVDSAFAWDEGEGDRTRADWLAMHVRYFTAQGAAQGFSFRASMPAVFERFTQVWPPQHADPQ